MPANSNSRFTSLLKLHVVFLISTSISFSANNGKRDLDMNLFNSLTRSIKNVFVGSHKGEDIKDEWFTTSHPHDIMPIANGSNRYAPPEKLAELEEEIKTMAEKKSKTRGRYGRLV